MVVCLAITSESQIVNMNDVYKYYGKDKGMINTSCEDFLSIAEKYIDALSMNDIMQVGDVGTRVLFEKMAEELDIFRNAIFGYTEDRRDYFKRLNAKQQAEYKTYTAKKRSEELNERWANKNMH